MWKRSTVFQSLHIANFACSRCRIGENAAMNKQPDFAALFDASPYPYLLIGPDFVLIGANPAYLRATGRTAEDL